MRKYRDLVLSSGRTLPSVDIEPLLDGHRDRGLWSSGPWDDEPDKIVWVDEGTDLDCMIVRNHLGAFCGYVGAPKGHPWFGFGYSECMTDCGEEWCHHTLEGSLRVHGGITYTAVCQEQGDVCHTPRRGRPHDVWWIGFDCAHGGDYIPGLIPSGGNFPGEIYRDLDYVVSQVELLAEQCKPLGRAMSGKVEEERR